MNSMQTMQFQQTFVTSIKHNGSLTHNCIYRLEAVETGDNTGIFEGTVEYLNLKQLNITTVVPPVVNTVVTTMKLRVFWDM